MCRYLLLIVLIGFSVTGCEEVPKATKSYAVINTASEIVYLQDLINKQPPGQPVNEFLTNTGLLDAKYDIVHSPNPSQERRIYHLNKAYLSAYLDILPTGINMSTVITPRVDFDGLDRKQRMNAHYENLREIYKDKNKSLDSIKNK